jgi:dTDP-4-amino-4,6-dideoxygalactose transaminase
MLFDGSSMSGDSVNRAGSPFTVEPTRIPLCKPYLSEDEEAAVIGVLRSGWLMQGSQVNDFEKLIADYVGTKHAIAVNSGTSALTIALMALGMTAGDKTLMPSYSFVATANSTVHWAGTPVFVDIGSEDYNIDPCKIESAVESGVRALIVVHQFGFPADMDPVLEVSNKHKLAVVEDAACSLGSEYKKRKTGSLGDVACLSFHPRKIITTGEGGMVVTDSNAIAQRVRSLRNHGLAPPPDGTRARCSEAGYNYRMTDIQAAIGITQFNKLPEIIRLRTMLAERYVEALSGLSALRFPEWPQNSAPNYQTFAIELADDVIDREAVLDRMRENGIECCAGIQPIHLEPAYAKDYSDVPLPETMRAARRSFFLPLYPGMTIEEQDVVITSLKKALMAKET